MTRLPENLLDLLRRPPSAGVLTVTAAPGAESGRRHAPSPASTAVRAALHDEERRVREEGPRERWAALRDRIADLGADLDWLVDPTAPGRGRALIVPLDGSAPLRLTLPVPVEASATVEAAPHLTPLIGPLLAAAPAGAALVSRHGVRAYEVAGGRADELWTDAWPDESAEWRRMEGPAGDNPRLAQHSESQRDLFLRRLEQHRERFLTGAAERVAGLASDRGWDRVVVAGDPRLRSALERGLPAGVAVVEAAAAAREGLSPAEVGSLLADEVAAARTSDASRLAERIRDAGLAGDGRAALGVGEVLGALEEGRVFHLVLDPSRAIAGVRAPDGRLAPAGEVPPGAPVADLEPVPHLMDVVVRRALVAGAGVTPVSGEGARILEEHEGVAAELRW